MSLRHEVDALALTHLKKPEATVRVSRRDFLAKIGWGSLLAAVGSFAAAFMRFLHPNVVTPSPGPVELGSPEDYAVGSLTFLDQARVYLGHDTRGYYAIIAVCTHLGCTPRLESNELACPCHGSRYSLDGQVITGAAKRPLDRALIWRAANGHLFVDRSHIVEADWRLRL